MMFSALMLSMAMVGQNSIAEGGCLRTSTANGELGVMVPLKKTVVNADIAGMGARVTVVQSFVNESKSPIEAIYTFPLPADGAVDRMRMQIGARVIEGEIKRREEARAIYEAAKRQGRTASLLDQERPNVFTQSIANIMPGARIDIEISYVQLVSFEEGRFEFSFPMVVGPRFSPPGTNDPEKVTPPVLAPLTRSGAEISMNVSLNVGAAINGMESVLHPISTEKSADGTVRVTLANRDEIPNRDFILRWTTAGSGVSESLLSHWDGNEGTFCLMLRPPPMVETAALQPKEVVFVMDQSGSQSGFPLEKSKELTLKLIPTLHPQDTFNVMSFAETPVLLWPAPRSGSPENIAAAMEFVKNLQANGGTMFAPAIEAALSRPPLDGRMRVVIFNTDGYVGNDFEVLELVKKHRANGRMFTFGIGSSVNRFLIDAMSVEGRGDSEVVTLGEAADGAAQRLIRRIESPLLTDIEARVEGVAATDMTPEHIPDVFLGKPIILFGRYKTAGVMRIQLTGKLGGKPWSRTVEADLRQSKSSGAALTSLWARRKIEDLMRQDWTLGKTNGANAAASASRREDIVKFALRHSLMSQFTSFVAVEKKVVNIGGRQRTVNVPVDLADGLDPEMAGAGRNSLARPGFGGGGAGGALAAPPASSKAGFGDVAEKMAEVTTASKISAKLAKTGIVEVQVRLRALSKTDREALKKAGLTIDDEDSSLKIAFGRIDGSHLDELAKLDIVIAIDPL